MVREALPSRAFIRMYIIESATDAAWKREGEIQVSHDQNRVATEIILERKKCGD